MDGGQASVQVAATPEPFAPDPSSATAVVDMQNDFAAPGGALQLLFASVAQSADLIDGLRASAPVPG